MKANPLFVKIFGQLIDFKGVHTDGVFRINHAINSVFFEFFIDHKKELIILERHENGRKVLELLPSLQTISKHLSTLYSHWVSREDGTIYFRPIDAFKRNVSYVAASNSQVRSNELVIHEIPLQFRNSYWWSPQHCRFERLIDAKESQSYKVLSNFDKFIHVFVDDAKNIRFSMVRFNLDFVFDGSVLQLTQYRNYFLNTNPQSIKGIFQNFSHFLSLHSNDGLQDLSKILIPKGEVVVKERGKTAIALDEKLKAKEFCEFDVHPSLSDLRTQSLYSRLQLVLIYSLEGPKNNENYKMPNPAISLDYLRQCFVDRALTADELTALLSITKAKFLSVALLAQYYAYLNRMQGMLFTAKYNESAFAPFKFDLGHYRFMASNFNIYHPDEFLTFEEEAGIFGQVITKRFITAGSISLYESVIHPNSLAHFTEKIEEEMLGLLQQNPDEQPGVCSLLSLFTDNSEGLKRKFIADLEQSSDAYRSTKTNTLSYPCLACLDTLQGFLLETSQLKNRLEKYLTRIALRRDGKSDISFKLKLIGYQLHAPTLKNLLLASIDDELFQKLFHVGEYASIVRTELITFLKLCVLEDKLRRCILLAAAGSEDKLIRELECKRYWDPVLHPRWLCFEIEGQLQIRPEQYHIAKHLISQKAASSQLNMGLGKTRVIVPMLILEALDRKKDLIPRLQILSQLLREGIDFFHFHLTASILKIRVFEAPFHRQLLSNPTLNGVKREQWISLFAHFLSLKFNLSKRNSVIILSPEHRLSLLLNAIEFSKGFKSLPFLKTLNTIVSDDKFWDIFDEVDELLHFRYELVYSIGEEQLVPDAKIRCLAIQAVMRSIQKFTFKETVGIQSTTSSGEYDCGRVTFNLLIIAF